MKLSNDIREDNQYITSANFISVGVIRHSDEYFIPPTIVCQFSTGSFLVIDLMTSIYNKFLSNQNNDEPRYLLDIYLMEEDEPSENKGPLVDTIEDAVGCIVKECKGISSSILVHYPEPTMPGYGE